MISQTAMPAFQLGHHILKDSLLASNLFDEGKPTLFVVDAYWTDQPQFKKVLASLPGKIVVFDHFTGEPKASHIAAAAQAGRDAGTLLVVGMGGGSALDIAKMTALCLTEGHGPKHYALGANPIPNKLCDLVQVPTTAGTGSEANGTAIFADDAGGKLWAYSPAMKPKLAILDAALLDTLPAHLKAWCGMDALIHAFEAGTNNWANQVNTAQALRAIELILPALPKAVKGDAQAQENLLLGSFLAGFAIENTGTSIAHCTSHAMARFAPIHHGLATALAFEVTLPNVIATPSVALNTVAAAFDTPPDGLPQLITDLMDSLKIERALPPAFESVSADALFAEMQVPANAPMLVAAPMDKGPAILKKIATSILALNTRTAVHA